MAMNALLEGLKALGTVRLIGLGVAAAVTVAALLTLTMVSGGTPMTLLYGGLDLTESAQIVEHLDKQHIPYQLRDGGRRILVPADQVDSARLMLARDALPSGGVVGYEIVDRSSGIFAGRFEQRINQLRALEGELVRTIRIIDGVRNARVHVVLPRREPFERRTPEARASVLLTTGPGGVDKGTVRAIVHLVATAVPGLKLDNITVADQRGTLLTRPGDSGPGGAGERAEELRRGIELRIARSVEEMLERSVGPGKVRAEASVTLDLARVKELHENYNPDGQVVRSTQTSNTTSKSTEASPGTVSVQNNLPNADAGQQSGGSQEQRQDETTNYEISKTVRNIVRDQPQIARISLAVLVDGVEQPNPDGKPVWRPRSKEELDQMSRLVKTAIGFDAKRGDQVEVASLRFADVAEPAPPAPPRLLGFPVGRDDILAILRTALPPLVALAVLIFILRPIVRRLTAPPLGVEGGSALAAASPGRLDEKQQAALPPTEDNEEIVMQNVEGALRATSVRRLTGLVERHPDESLSIVRGWLRQEPG
jgi:flagellar M-ring protein FliF